MGKSVNVRPVSVLVVALLVVSGARAWAQSDIPRDEMWVTNGSVYAIVRTLDTIYLGGTFTYVGPYTGNGLPISTGTGQPAGTYPKVNGTVAACVPDGSGGWYIGGNFTQVGSFARNCIAHILSNGSVDSTWNPNAEGGMYPFVWTLAVSGTKVYAGGSFTSIGGQIRNYIAALDTTTGLATAWNPNTGGINPVVHALVVSGTKVYVGGTFTSIGGQDRGNIAALDTTTGLATAWNPNGGGGKSDACVNALAVSGSTVYAGGAFTWCGGQIRLCVAALNATTGLATAWNPSADLPVHALLVSGTTVYAGGSFMNIGGQPRNGFAALNATTGLATAWNPNAVGAPLPEVRTLAVSGTTVYAGGSFTSVGGQTRNNIAALDVTTGLATAWNPNANLSVLAMAVSGTKMYVGGDLTSIGGQTRNHIAALDVRTGSSTYGCATAWSADADNTVAALAVSGATVYAGGNFTNIGGQARNRIAALNATTGLATAWNPNADRSVLTMALSGTTIYAGGQFTSIGGQPRSGIAALDATTGLAADWNPSASGNYVLVRALAVSGSTVYAGGHFTSIGGQTRNYIAALDTTTGLASTWNPNASFEVYVLAVSGSTVYAGGDFVNIGGQPRNNIAALDATTGLATPWNPNAGETHPYVNALAVSGTKVYAGGNFRSIGGQPRSYIAALDATTGLATTWNPAADYEVLALAASGTTVYVGGAFTNIGGQGHSHFAEFPSLTRPQITIEGPTPPSTTVEPVSYLVTYTGAVSVTLNESDVSLLTALGDVSADVAVTGTADPFKWVITLSNITGTGKVTLRIGDGTAVDDEGNLALQTDAHNNILTVNPDAFPLHAAWLLILLPAVGFLTLRRRTHSL